MKSKHLFFIGIVFVMCNAFIVTRHDISDEEYINYGKKGFESLAVFEDGNGTLIDKQWVLTARHIADDQKPGSIVTINGTEYKVEKIVLYPQKPTDDLFKKKDLGLIKLNQPVSGVVPVKYIKKSPEIGSILYLAGNGDVGNGKTGPTNKDKKIRAATNTLDSLKDHFISFVFDSPTSGKATKLEGTPGPGDSGGPAYIKENGTLVLAGVSSFEVVENRQQQGRYGVRNYYPNVSLFADWIESTIKGERYYKTIMDGKEIVSIKRADGSYYLGVDGEKAVVDDLIKYGERVIHEYNDIEAKETAWKQRQPDMNDPQMQFAFYLEALMKEAGIKKSLREATISISTEKFTVEGKEMPENLKSKALKKFEELFKQPLGNNQINLRPRNN